jgi:hypothetical protein
VSAADAQKSLHQIEALAGHPAASKDVVRSLDQTQMLLAIVAKVWEIEAHDVPPTTAYSADWDERVG